MITNLRSAVFFVTASLWTALVTVLMLPALAMSRDAAQAVARTWSQGLIRQAEWICGLRYRIVGAENIPTGAAIIAAKHQSAWDTFVFHDVLVDPVFVMKRELFKIPLVGWYMQKAGSVGVDRSSPIKALKTVSAEARQALAAGRQVVIFPEGTRVAPRVRAPYRAGIAVLYERCAAPVVPVALNSGFFWGRRSFRKEPGLITLQFLPPIEPGLDRRAFTDTLRARIETASDDLANKAEAQLGRRRFPSEGEESGEAAEPGE